MAPNQAPFLSSYLLLQMDRALRSGGKGQVWHLQLAVNHSLFQEGWGTHHPKSSILGFRQVHPAQGYQCRVPRQGPAQPPPPSPAPAALPCPQTSITYTPDSLSLCSRLSVAQKSSPFFKAGLKSYLFQGGFSRPRLWNSSLQALLGSNAQGSGPWRLAGRGRGVRSRFPGHLTLPPSGVGARKAHP